MVSAVMIMIMIMVMVMVMIEAQRHSHRELMSSASRKQSGTLGMACMIF